MDRVSVPCHASFKSNLLVKVGTLKVSASCKASMGSQQSMSKLSLPDKTVTNSSEELRLHQEVATVLSSALIEKADNLPSSSHRR